MALTATIKAGVTGSYTSALDLATASLPLALSYSNALTDGTAANQAQKAFIDKRTLAASGTEDLDLAGSLTDAYGATLTFTKIKAILIYAASGNTNNVVVGGAGSNAFIGFFGDATDTISVKPDGLFLVTAPGTAGMTVTAATGDILTITNSSSGSSVTYDIAIIGV